jgi:transcriptional regulator with XRE-family HTH domain
VTDTSGRNPDDIRIGGAIKALRDAHGLTRRQLAAAIGKGDKLIAAIEQGHRHATAPVQRLIVDRLAVPLDALSDEALLAEYLTTLRREVRPEAVTAA